MSAQSRRAKSTPGVAFEQVLSYPADVTNFGHPDDPPPGFKVIRLWRFADTELRRVTEPTASASGSKSLAGRATSAARPPKAAS